MRSIRQASLAVALLCAATFATATTHPKIELSRLVQQADLIVEGTVTGAETLWIGKELYTRYTVQVSETLLGSARTTVPVLVLGGIDYDRPHPVGMMVAGAPTFLPQERALLLLQEIFASASGDYAIVGFNQGKITTGTAGLQSRNVPGAASVPGASAKPRESTDKLREQLRQLIREHSANRVQPSAREQVR